MDEPPPVEDLHGGAASPAGVRWRWGWLLLVLAGPAVYAALAYDTAATAVDAAGAHIYRAVVFSQAISEGFLYPRWVQFLHWGLGSPLFTFNAPLPYYALDLLYRLGLPHPLGWRVLMAAGLLLACVGTYLFVFGLTRQRWPSLAAAVIFLYAPYVLRNTFGRGSLEAISLFLSPWVLWALVRLAQRPTVARFLIASLLWALCIASHVLGPLMLLPLAALLAAGLAWSRRTLLPFAALLAGGLLAAFVWAPMIPEQSWVQTERDFEAGFANPLQNPISLDRLLAPPTVYDIARDNNAEGEQTGLVHACVLLAGIPTAIWAWRRGNHRLALWLAASLAIGLALFWMLTSSADPIWRAFGPVLQRLQYRSRLNGMQALAVATVGGLSLTLLPRRWQPRAAGLVLALVVLSALPSLHNDLRHRYALFGDPVSLPEVRRAEIESGGSAFTSYGEFTPRWRTAPFDQALLDELGSDFAAAASSLARPVEGVSIGSAGVRSSAWDVSFSAAQSSELALHLLYYPRWQATIDGRPVPIRPEAGTGYVRLEVPAGEHHLALRYRSTSAERAGIVVSVAALLLLLGLLIWSRVSRPRRELSDAVARPTGLAETQRVSGAESRPAGPPSLWVLVALTGLLVFKMVYVDRHTSWLRCTSTSERVCGMPAAAQVKFAHGLQLRGYDVETPVVAPGGTLKVQVTWQSGTAPLPRLHSFVHVRNSRQDWPLNPHTGGDIWAQQDTVAPGRVWTEDWLPGKLYREAIELSLPPNMPPGTYFLEVGWFDPATGEQLPVEVDSVAPPLRELWRSILLPSVEVR
jgi:hypothetical protein